MAFVYETNQQSGVLFFFHKCGTTMVRDRAKQSGKLYTFENRGQISDLPEFYNYEKLGRKETVFMLARHPIKRFFSGYWHYWRYWEDNHEGWAREWVQGQLNRQIQNYSMDVHITLFQVLENRNFRIDTPHDYIFWCHCMHDLADEYVVGMKVIQLGQLLIGDLFLSNLLTEEIYNASETPRWNHDYPDLQITSSQHEYIHKRYTRAMNLFGYGNDWDDYPYIPILP